MFFAVNNRPLYRSLFKVGDAKVQPKLRHRLWFDSASQFSTSRYLGILGSYSVYVNDFIKLTKLKFFDITCSKEKNVIFDRKMYKRIIISKMFLWYSCVSVHFAQNVVKSFQNRNFFSNNIVGFISKRAGFAFCITFVICTTQ